MEKRLQRAIQRPLYLLKSFQSHFREKQEVLQNRGFTLKITYFQEAPEELQQLQLVDTVKEAFGMVFTVQDRKLTVGEITHDYIGQKEDILQISVDFEFYENTATEPEGETAGEMDFNLSKTEEA